jgi:membrane protein YdbS with pleckstrin-like domain
MADGVDRQLDPRVVPLQRTVGLITALVVAAGSVPAVLAAWGGSGSSWPGLLGFAVLWAAGNTGFAWHLQRWPAIEYRHAWYRIDRLGIEIRRGVFWRTVINVPRSRVQHTDVSQGPLERRFGLGTLVIYTAGTDHARVALAGLDHRLALRIREHLTPEQGGDAV